jgi:predicted HTH domain antitoxin
LESTVTLQDVIEITEELSLADQLRLVATLTDRLSREIDRGLELLQLGISHAETLERALVAYRQDQVTLARAAEMVGITRWELMRILKARGTPVTVEVPPVEELDRDLAAYLK